MKTLAIGALLALTMLVPPKDSSPTLYLAGDSTMADKPLEPPNPERGWGQLLATMVRPAYRVSNHAMNGRSTRSFLTEGRWQAIVDSVHQGDWVLIQFAHNDEKSEDTARYAAARGAYQANLRRMVREARSKGAMVMLATPVVRRKFDSAGALVNTHGDYPAAMREVAREDGVPLLELNERSADVVRAAGPEASKALYLWIAAGRYALKPEGWSDDTHFSEAGAKRVATLAIQEMRRLKLPIAAWFSD